MRILFLLTIPLMFIQYAVLKIAGEPYPAIMMPGFQGNGGFENGRFRTRKMEALMITSDNVAVSFSQREVLSEYPDSFDGVLTLGFLSPLHEEPTDAQAPSRMTNLQYLRRTLLPHLHAGERNRTDPDNAASLGRWLRSRASVLLPDHQVVRVEFRWVTETIWMESGELRFDRQPAGTFVVPLGNVSP